MYTGCILGFVSEGIISLDVIDNNITSLNLCYTDGDKPSPLKDVKLEKPGNGLCQHGNVNTTHET